MSDSGTSSGNNFYMGIDGGGTNLRVAVVNQALGVMAQSLRGTANPNAVGRETAVTLIQDAMREAIQGAGITADQVAGVGIGVAGAPVERDETWLRDIVTPVTPKARIVPSSDHEIALVAALGERYGLLILSGTGSNVYAVNREGQSAQVGGWGYLLGDEGSGYWIGMQALRAVVHHADGSGHGTRLTDEILTKLGLDHPKDLIAWIYQNNRHRDIAGLASVVLELAAGVGDSIALSIIERAAQELKAQADTALKRLHVQKLPVALTGGLLESANMLSLRLCELLELPELPTMRHSQVVGAALLAMPDTSLPGSSPTAGAA